MHHSLFPNYFSISITVGGAAAAKFCIIHGTAAPIDTSETRCRQQNMVSYCWQNSVQWRYGIVYISFSHCHLYAVLNYTLLCFDGVWLSDRNGIPTVQICFINYESSLCFECMVNFLSCQLTKVSNFQQKSKRQLALIDANIHGHFHIMCLKHVLLT